MNYTKSKVGDICTMVKGTYPTMKTLPGGYPFVVTAAYRRTASTYQIDDEAVCIPLISSTGHGDAAIHRVHYQNGKFALANLLVALIPKDKNICNAKYLYHLLMVKKDEYLVPLMRGTANVSLKEQDVAKVEIPLPPLEEQRRIVARVEEMVGKFEEVRSLRQQAFKEIEALIASSSDEIFKLKSGWIEAAVGDFCEQPQYGYTESATYEPVGPHFLRITDIQNGHVNWKNVPFCRCPYPEQYLLKNNDLVFARTGGTTGKSFLIRSCPKAVFASYLIRLRVKKPTVAKLTRAIEIQD